MDGQLITFEDIRGRQEIDLIGGTMEIYLNKLVYRGELDDILWWNHYPRRFYWIKSIEWYTNQQVWRASRGSEKQLNFQHNSIESFAGPFELVSGELFFMFSKYISVTLFPKGCSLPDAPRNEERYESLCKCFL